MIRRLLRALPLLAAAAPLPAQGPRAAPAARPSLVVLLTVDQMRADYLERFAPQLRGGLARLVRGGARFTDAHQDHAITETAPGHATLLSGRFPRSTGIWSNWAGVEDPERRLVGGAPGAGASPTRFRGTTLVDWLRTSDPRSRALSVSGKDRSAILPIGRGRSAVFWYALDGRFTTSTYYADSLPTWVAAFNARQSARGRAGQLWRLLLPDSAYSEPDSVAAEAGGQDFLFPHQVPGDSAGAASYVRVTPWLDEILLDFALDGVRALALGGGRSTDVLNVSLSATDYIGHRYGPDSREMHDQVLRLDRAVGAFLDSLFRVRDSTGVVVVLTADHGVSAIPEIARGGAGGRPVRVDLLPALGPAREALRIAGADTGALVTEGSIVILDREALGAARLDADSLLDHFAADVRRIPGVLRVDRWRDLRSAGSSSDAIARRWAHQLPAGALIDLVVTLTPGSVWGASGPVATHGSPHDDDSHVPLIFYGAPFRPGRYPEFVRTVDIAPTLATVTATTPTERVDGVVLRRALR